MPTSRECGAAQELATLKLTYERLCQERDRLRAARGFFARGLGPAPASAGIATALVAALGDGKNPGLLAAATGVLIAMILLSIAYDGKPAYRHLYASEIKAIRTQIAGHPRLAKSSDRWEQEPEDLLPPAEWYRAMIQLERALYGREREKNRLAAPWKSVRNLQDGADVERTGVRLVQTLWVIVVALLVAATVI